jgi:hypothetical protein
MAICLPAQKSEHIAEDCLGRFLHLVLLLLAALAACHIGPCVHVRHSRGDAPRFGLLHRGHECLDTRKARFILFTIKRRKARKLVQTCWSGSRFLPRARYARFFLATTFIRPSEKGCFL